MFLLSIFRSPTLWLIGIVGAAAFSGYLYVKHMEKDILELEGTNVTLKVNQDQLKDVIDGERETLKRTREQYEVLQREYNELKEANAAAEVYSEKLLKLLTKHDLEYLALKKPGLIENRINNASKNIFADIESITTN